MLPRKVLTVVIIIKKRVTMNGVSVFSESNILIEDIKETPTPANFKADYENSATGVLAINNSVDDELEDWNISPWNTVGRKGVTPYSLPFTSSSEPFEKVGFAAEKKICGTSSCQPDNPSVADGVYGYDSTTGTKGNNLKLLDKIPQDKIPNDSGTITYAFERIVPDAARLKLLAQNHPGGSKYHKGSSPPWNTLFPDASEDPKVVFIDAEGSGVTFKNTAVANSYGILVVWCGKLTLESEFKGIIVTLHGKEGDSDWPGGKGCEADKGGVVIKGQTLTGYAYDEGDIDRKAFRRMHNPCASWR